MAKSVVTKYARKVWVVSTRVEYASDSRSHKALYLVFERACVYNLLAQYELAMKKGDGEWVEQLYSILNGHPDRESKTRVLYYSTHYSSRHELSIRFLAGSGAVDLFGEYVHVSEWFAPSVYSAGLSRDVGKAVMRLSQLPFGSMPIEFVKALRAIPVRPHAGEYIRDDQFAIPLSPAEQQRNEDEGVK